jgi:hypothetical protein
MLAKNEQSRMCEAEARSAIRAVMAREPNLTAFGWGVFLPHTKTARQIAAELKVERQDLLNDWQQFANVVALLSRFEKRASINYRYGTSYGLKHNLAQTLGYVCNGTFIAAALHCGFKHEQNGPNSWLNISSCSLNAVYLEQEAAV